MDSQIKRALDAYEATQPTMQGAPAAVMYNLATALRMAERELAFLRETRLPGLEADADELDRLIGTDAREALARRLHDIDIANCDISMHATDPELPWLGRADQILEVFHVTPKDPDEEARARRYEETVCAPLSAEELAAIDKATEPLSDIVDRAAREGMGGYPDKSLLRLVDHLRRAGR